VKTPPFEFDRLKVLPLAGRNSQLQIQRVLIDPDGPVRSVSPQSSEVIADCARKLEEARKNRAAVILIYGAHLVKNGGARIVQRLMQLGWITHLATNGAGVIHDWEFAWCGRSSEDVRENVARGTFGAWDETSSSIHLAIMAGALDALGYGGAVGRFIVNDGATLPTVDSLAAKIAAEPDHPLTAARADLLRAIRSQRWPSGWLRVEHHWRDSSILACAFELGLPMTVHPGIGYDIISNHPVFNGAAIGRAAELDFKLLCGSVDQLDGGVLVSIGSAIMGPQVFEKSLSCVNNVRVQRGRQTVSDHTIYVVDLHDGGGWDWTQGEPPTTNPAYYLRFCKTYSRMGCPMKYAQCDNVEFLHRLYQVLAHS
jgi:hypothetical protein